MQSFKKLGIESDILKSLEALGYHTPTEVQEAVIPEYLAGEDIVVKSQTGSGKTASFGIPMAHAIKWEQRTPQAIVLVPTRELALQVRDEIFNIGRYKRLKVAAIYGKHSFDLQARDLAQMTHVVVATPGRLMDHIQRRTIDISQVGVVVIDEADEMFNMGFIDQVMDLLEKMPYDAQKILLSATLSASIEDLVAEYLKEPTYIEVSSEDRVGDRITQHWYGVQPEDKVDLLRDVLVVENPDRCIIFCNTKMEVDALTANLRNLAIKPQTLHGNMDQKDRTAVIDAFKHGAFRYLIATDVAARGLDITDVSLVVNYDIPDHAETYTHRIGRTARVEKEGKAVSFVTPFNQRAWGEVVSERFDELVEAQAPKGSLIHARRSSFDAKQSRTPKPIKAIGSVFKQDITRLHINAGKKHKMRPGDLVGAIASIAGVSGADIGVIEVLDASSYVEILNEKGKIVMNALKDNPIKGKVRRVSVAFEKDYTI